MSPRDLVTSFCANARMYAAGPEVEALWEQLFACLSALSGVALRYERHPAPAPLGDLWGRADLGCAFVCGYPFSTGAPPLVGLAVPLPRSAARRGEAAYATLLMQRIGGRAATPAEVPVERIGWTAADSLSGGLALREYLRDVGHTAAERLFEAGVGPLIHPRAALEALQNRRVDLAPLDSYFHSLLRRHAPHRLAGLVEVDRTPARPMPLLAAAAGIEDSVRKRLTNGLLALAREPAAAVLLDALDLDGFAAVDRAAYAPLSRLGD